jgi:Flp pilus assembly protein TadD
LGQALQHGAPSKEAIVKAEYSFRRTLELDPNHAQAHLELGLLLKRVGNNDEARSEFATAAKLAPGLVQAHQELGNSALASQDWSTAVREFQAVLAWSPDDKQAHYDLARALKGNFQQ